MNSVILVLVLTLTLTLTLAIALIAFRDKSEHFRSVENYDAVGDQITWTYRYLSKYYTKLFQEWLTELEIANLHIVTPQITPISEKELKSSVPVPLTAQDPISEVIDNTISYLERRLNTRPNIIFEPTEYYKKNDTVMVKLRKNMFYDTQAYYQKDLNANTNNESYLIMKITADNKIASIGIAGLPKITHHHGAVPERQGRAFLDNDIGINKQVITDSLRKLVSSRLMSRLSRCFLKPQYKELDNNDNDIGTEQSCTISGGVWDTPCDKDIDCPYFKANKNYPNKFGGCNRNTGFCQLPEGLKPLSFRKGLGQPSCYSCKKGKYGSGSVGNCCDEQKRPDYRYKDDFKVRSKYKKMLSAKGLNWYQY